MENKNAEKKLSSFEKVLLVGIGIIAALLVIGIPALYLFIQSQPWRNVSQKPVTQALEIISTPAPRSITTNSPTLAPKPTKGYAQKSDDVREDIALVDSYIQQEEWALAIKNLDDLIKKMPDDGELYYKRATCYHEMYHGLRSETEGLDYLDRAMQDLDRAIALSAPDGEQYHLRYTLYLDRSYLFDYRVDMNYMGQIALDNLITANELGNSDELRFRNEADLYFDLKKCDEGFQAIENLMRAQPPQEPSAGLHTILASGLVICRKDYSDALQAMDIALEIYPSIYRHKARALILYYLGRKEESLQVLDTLINDDPYYNGERYYLRALIRYENGQSELAEQDLAEGYGNTWYHGGLYLYVQARMELDRGNKEEGIRLMQEAEATMPQTLFYSPFIDRIREELATLGASPYELEVSAPFQATPIVLPKP